MKLIASSAQRISQRAGSVSAQRAAAPETRRQPPAAMLAAGMATLQTACRQPALHRNMQALSAATMAVGVRSWQEPFREAAPLALHLAAQTATAASAPDRSVRTAEEGSPEPSMRASPAEVRHGVTDFSAQASVSAPQVTSVPRQPGIKDGVYIS
jgi:hypothetical protein